MTFNPVDFASKLMSGAVAGVMGYVGAGEKRLRTLAHTPLSTSLIFPLDFVKTHGQASGISMWKCFGETVAKSGYKGLYSGLKSNLLGVFPEKAIKLAMNDLTRGE
jgi:hypothetical protein